MSEGHTDEIAWLMQRLAKISTLCCLHTPLHCDIAIFPIERWCLLLFPLNLGWAMSFSNH